MTTRDYDATAANNTTIEGITLSDAMLANALDNSIRALMADAANALLDTAEPTSTTGSSNAYVLATGGTVAALADKVRLLFRANFSNTGACTINVDSLGAADLKIYGPSGITDPAAGQIQSGGVYDVVYVAALSDFVVLNPTPLTDLLNDTTPQLGGTLDTNSKAVFLSKGADVASATELLVLTDGNSFDVTGTTTITSIETTADAFGIGSEIQLQFDGVLTLTHHATDLILPGGANITTAAGDIAIFRKYAAGDWRCENYSPASGRAVVEVDPGQRFIESQDISSDATIEFTGFDATLYDAYLFVLGNVTPVNNNVSLQMRFSTDGGSTYVSTAGAYAYVAKNDPAGSPAREDYSNSATSISLAGHVASATGEHGVSGDARMFMPHLTVRTQVTGLFGYFDQNAEYCAASASGIRLASEDTDAVQFFFSSGSLESGTITMYGLRNA